MKIDTISIFYLKMPCIRQYLYLYFVWLLYFIKDGIRFTPSILLLNEDGTIHSVGTVHRLQDIIDQSKDFMSPQRNRVELAPLDKV